MKYHAIITIVDDNNNEITSMVKHECRQFNLSKSNVLVHEIYVGTLSILEGREMCQFIEEVKGGAE